MKKPIHLFIGLALAALTIIIHLSFSEARGLEFSSFLLVLIGSVYLGFAALSHDRKAAAIEVLVACIFVAMGVAGLWVSPWILIAGLFLHGCWDLAHHNNFLKLVRIPKWYIPFCVAYDWAMGIYLSIVYLNSAPSSHWLL